MKLAIIAILAGLALAAAEPAAAQDLEVRFCPGGALHTWPLADLRKLQSVLVQNVAIVNRGAPLTVTGIDLQLIGIGEIQEERHFTGKALATMAGNGPAVQQSGMLAAVAFQFCGTDMIAPDVNLAGPALGRNEALLVMAQAFAFAGARDALRVVVHYRRSAGEASSSTEIPIVAGFAKNTYAFPLRGTWYAGVGPTFHTGHRWAIPEEFAYDVARIGETGLTYKGDGTRFSDYYAYGADVLAAADGKVVAVENTQREDTAAMRKPGETQVDYFTRLQNDQAQRLAKGTSGLAGNYVMIDHGKGEYSLSAHLQPGSVAVHLGDIVRAGQAIGKLGSSGNSTEPHLHWQVCDKPAPLMCAGIPVQFSNVEVPWADLPRAIQSGDVVIAK